MNIEGILSNSLLLIAAMDIFYKYLRGEKEILKKAFSYFFLIIGIIFTLKLIFKVPRPTTNLTDFDLYAFPSTHAGLAVLPIFLFLKDRKRIIFYSLMLLLIDFLRVHGGYHTIDQVIAGNIIILLSLFLVEKLINKIKDNGIERKFVHIGLSVSIGYITFLNFKFGMLLLSILIILGIILYVFFRNFFIIKDFLEWYSKDKTGKEALTLVGGIFISLLLGYMIGINAYYTAFYLGWLDGLSTIFAIYFHKDKKEKSAYSMIGGFFGGIIAYIATNTSILIIFPLLLIDYFYKGDDNMIIPISTLFLNILFSNL